jgi:hypothetical protein
MANPTDEEEAAPGDKPIWFARMIAERTHLTLAVCATSAVTMVAVPVAAGKYELTEDTNYDWIISTEDSSIHMDALASAVAQASGTTQRRLQSTSASSTWFLEPRSQWDWRDELNLRYITADGSNILTPRHLLTICKVENLFFADPGSGSSTRGRVRQVAEVPTLAYRQLCKLQTQGIGYSNWSLCSVPSPPPPAASSGYECACDSGAQIRSALKFFYPSRPDGSRDCSLLSPSVVATGAAALTGWAQASRQEDTHWYVGRDIKAASSGVPASTSRLRSELRLGFPLPGTLTIANNAKLKGSERDALPAEKQVAEPFWAEMQSTFYSFFDIGSWSESTEVDGLTVVFFSESIAGRDFFGDLISQDLMWAGGSIVFVLLVLCWHTSSLFLGGLGMVQIILSLPCTLFFYRVIFGIDFLTQMHVLSIYLVLGIGADDLFVFFDAWVQSEYMITDGGGRTDLVKRMDFAFRRSSSAMLTTSFTTMVSNLMYYYQPNTDPAMANRQYQNAGARSHSWQRQPRL